MRKIIINGGKKLQGEVTVSGAKNSVVALIPAIILLSLPCVLGFNIWSDIHPLGGNSGILDLEDFIISNNVLPLGSLVYLTFCTTRYGWGWDNFLEEVNLGTDRKSGV